MLKPINRNYQLKSFKQSNKSSSPLTDTETNKGSKVKKTALLVSSLCLLGVAGAYLVKKGSIKPLKLIKPLSTDETNGLIKKVQGLNQGIYMNHINDDNFVSGQSIKLGQLGEQFDAYGIAKGSLTEQLTSLSNFLTKGINKKKGFITAPLDVKDESKMLERSILETAEKTASKDGCFILVSDKGKRLADDGIKHVVVNAGVYSIFDDLAKRFPNVNFVKADDATNYFTQLATKV